MVRAGKLILIGYWAGPLSREGFPEVGEFVDASWDQEEREAVVDYLGRGHVARAYMGYSVCRICGRQNGSLELSDGHYVWPEGLRHYVVDHAVRLPQRFVNHVQIWTEELENAPRDEVWWSNQPEERKPE